MCSKLLACWVTVAPSSGVWGSCGVCATVRLLSSAKPKQGGEEGVGRIGRVILFDCEGQGERHEEVQEGPLRFSLGDPTAWLQEGAEALAGADCVFAGAAVVGGEVLEGGGHGVSMSLPKRTQGVSGKAPLMTLREAMMWSTGSMSAIMSWTKMASCVDRPRIPPQELAGMGGLGEGGCGAGGPSRGS